MEISKSEIVDVLNEYIHNRQDREVMRIYLTDYPGSLERLAYECDLSVSTVKRIVNRNAFVYRHLPGNEPKLS